MKPEGSLPYTQDLAIRPYPDPAASSPRHYIHMTLIYILILS